MNHSFEYLDPTKVIIGRAEENRIGEILRDFGASRVFVVYGGGSVIRSGLLENITKRLETAGIAYETFGGVLPNPRLAHAEEGVAKAIKFGADFILAVGGGSVIDTSKAIAHGTANHETTLWDIWLGKYPLKKSMPVGVVLTIPAAGSETSNSAVLTNEAAGIKKGLTTELNRPAFAVLDPELAYTLPKYQLTCGIVDIMMHTIDRYFAPGDGSNAITDEIAEGLLRTVIASGRKLLIDQTNYDAMSELMWCGSLSHNGITGLGREQDFSAHKLGHPLSAKYDIAHGATLSMVWGSWASYVRDINPARFARFAEKVWGITDGDTREKAEAGVQATVNYFREIGMPVSIGESKAGVLTEEALEALANNATSGGTIKVAKFLPLGYQECLDIYRLANY